MIDAIVFDFDGTILETEAPEYQAWQDIYADYGGVLAHDVWIQCVGGGTDLFDPYEYLEEQIGVRVDREAVRARRRALFDTLVAAQALRPGIPALFSQAERMGIPLAVASSSDRAWVEGHLSNREILQRFAAVCTADDVAQVKPDPALYRLATTQLKAQPSRTLAIEDSRYGLLAAKAAGLTCVVVPNPVTAIQDFREADLVLETLEDVSLEALIATLW